MARLESSLEFGGVGLEGYKLGGDRECGEDATAGMTIPSVQSPSMLLRLKVRILTLKNTAAPFLFHSDMYE